MSAEPMRVLIACEFSGVVRREFDKLGHDVWSCDTRDAEDRSNRHIKGDVREILDWGLFLMSKQADLEFTPSTFGGGWLESLSQRGKDWAARYFETDAYFLAPINGYGWLIEPYEMVSVQAAVLQEQLVIQP